jgi:phospholipid transport system substrate-binding protein
MHRLRFVTVAAALLVLCATGPTFAADSMPPKAIVESFQQSLIAVMKEAKTLGVKGRYERLAPIIDHAFHLPLMTHIAASSHWNETTATQRHALVAAFRRMSASTLATLFDGYSGERFAHVGESAGPQGTLLVETRLVKSDNSTNDIAYVAKQIQNRWYLIDVIVDKGISELNVRRSEYRRVLQEQGVDGLIRVLNAKADELLAQKSG